MGFFGRKNKDGPVIKESIAKLHWGIDDPFLFASHHFDPYPKGNDRQAPPYSDVKDKGGDLGNDYFRMHGYNMYTGKVTPGFQLHSHWGYETITFVSKGYVDHFDHLGNNGRYGYGDMQWISAGSRYHHCEMYPLVFQDRENPQLITQIVLNLPLKDKNSPVEVNTVWAEDIPVVTGEGYTVTVLMGEFAGKKMECPNKVSWAADPEHHVRILRIDMEAGATMKLDTCASVNRNLFITEGKATVAGKEYLENTRLKLKPGMEVEITMGDKASEIWVLEGDPIDEKQSTWGSVVLGTDSEVRRAANEIREKELEEWKWEFVNQKQPLGTERFIKYADGTEKRPRQKNPGE